MKPTVLDRLLAVALLITGFGLAYLFWYQLGGQP